MSDELRDAREKALGEWADRTLDEFVPEPIAGGMRFSFNSGWSARDAEVERRIAAAKAEALNEVADFLDGRGILWHGDSGVTVMGQPYSGQLGVRLTDWLRARAVASEGTG